MYGSDEPERAAGALRPGALGPEHLEVCLRLDQATLAGLWTPAQWRDELSDGQRLKRALWRGPDLVAMACGWLVLDELHITLLAVHPAQRRRGLGSRVLRDLLAEARRRGAAAATLEVNAANTAARGLYDRLGFRIRGRRRGYYRDGGDALIQWTSLGGPEEAG
jgi:ribosomal-protein-alanine N-acetyltransferase